MHVRPLHDRILVQRLEEGEQQVGGIIIPDSGREKPQRGKVIAAGNGKPNDEGAGVAGRQSRRHHPLRQVLRSGDQGRFPKRTFTRRYPAGGMGGGMY